MSHKEFHVRYFRKKDQRWHEMRVHDDREEALAARQACEDAGYEAKVFVRDVSLWREDIPA